MQPIDLNNFIEPVVIGKGGFHFAYSIIEKKTNKMLAALVRIGGEDQKDLINKEIQIIEELNHPTIIKFFGYSLTDFKGDHNFTLVLEYAKNNSLYEALEKEKKGNGQLDDTTKQIILIGTARALLYLHQHNIAHLNVKPSKILLDDSFRPHLSGFELSEFCRDKNSCDSVKGTILYMAPEVIEGSYWLEADVYSFAILMFEVVDGSHPFNNIKNRYLFQQGILRGERPEFKNPVKPKIKELIEKCWSSNPADRPKFETIFNLLAHRRDPFDVFSENKSHDYYISDNVDEKKVKQYVDEIKNDSSILAIDELTKTVLQLKKENEEMRNEINELKKKLENSNK